nr:reverse transcriptase domain-containing protein [Tanacetum cinerariifolium]
MSAMTNTTPIVTTVKKPATNPRDADATPRVNIQDFCEEYYKDILPIIMDKARRDKRKEVHARLDFGEGSRERRTREGSHYSSARALTARPERLKVRDRLRYTDRHVLDRLGTTNSRDHPRGKSPPHKLDASNEGRPEDRERFRGVGESYDDSHSHSYHDRDRSRHMKRRSDSESPLSSVSKSDFSDGRYQKSKSKRHKPTDEDDLTRPWMREEVDPFTPRIRNFESSRRTRMPNNLKTYDITGDPEDHVKIIQAAAQVERWVMPTWCHMFNSTLIGAARVWFDEVPPESINSYKDLKAAFLAYFMKQKKYVKDLVEIHNIKQKDGETIEDFMERFKVETGRMKGAPECMRIFEFMHKVNNPELTKRLNEHVPKTVEEMMFTTTAFIRGEAVAASKKKGHAPWRTHDQSKMQTSEKRTPKEILATETDKFQPPPPMVTPVEKRSSNKFCDFHNDKGHSTDECMQLKRQIEELVRAGKLSYLIKEIKHGRDQSKVRKKETPAKDKPVAIYMIQSWQRMTRKKVTQSFERVREITFSPLTTSSGTEEPLVIEAEIGGHMIHRMYVDGGSSMEILYEYCFNRLRPEVKNQMVPATTSLTGFSGETIWPLGQLMLLVTIGDADHSTRAWMNFMIIRSLLLYNGIIGRPGIKEIQAVPSTTHGMLKFPVDGGIVTIRSTILIPAECATVIHHLRIVTPFQKLTGKLNLYAATLSSVSWTLTKAITRYSWQMHVDDLVVKSHTEAEMLRDISETFCMLRKINMKLNPKKCTFGEVEGMFVGYMVTPERIKPCLEKTEAVLQLPSPQTIKEVQSLNGKLASLNRFLSKSAEKSLPLFKTLKKCIKKSDFHWTSEAEQAFKQLNQHLSELPLLVAPKPKEELILYLSTSYGAISAVLITERGTVQAPVYFIQLAESDEEKTAFHTGHGVYCYTKMPFGLKNAGATYQRLVDKVFDSQIGQNIEPRTSMKGQVLADFLAEIPDESQPDASVVETQQEPWTLFSDGSLCVDGSGAGFMLTSPEAQMGVRNVHVRVDSKLVSSQVLGAYVAKEENMIKHLEKVKSLVSGFTNFSINQVPRSKNKKADALSKIASTSFAHLSKQVLVEILKEKSIQEKEMTTVVEEDETTWMTSIMKYLKEGTLPSDKKETRKLRIKARQYELLEGVLYRRSFLTSWLRCVRPLQAEYPFYKWGIDITGPFPEGPCKVKFFIAAMDYFMKWIEAKAVATITGSQTGDFVYRGNDSSYAVDGGKLGPKWEGPYEVTEALGDGAYKLRSMDGTVLPRTWNIANLKRCYL